jgi:hypothetical protein
VQEGHGHSTGTKTFSDKTGNCRLASPKPVCLRGDLHPVVAQAVVAGRVVGMVLAQPSRWNENCIAPFIAALSPGAGPGPGPVEPGRFGIGLIRRMSERAILREEGSVEGRNGDGGSPGAASAGNAQALASCALLVSPAAPGISNRVPQPHIIDLSAALSIARNRRPHCGH